MNKTQKLINARAELMEDIIYTDLKGEYGIVGGYDYSENSLFRLCRRRLKKGIKEKIYSINDIREMNNISYLTLMEPLCKNVMHSFYKIN